MHVTGLDRRELIGSALAMAASAALAGADAAGAEAETTPKLKAPADACDCHMHIYDSRFPIDPRATLRPPDAHVDAYRQVQARLGLTRNVVVTPSTYGTDNSCTLDALAQLGPTARAVAVVDSGVTDAELRRLDGLGVRGIRFNLVQTGATTPEMVEPLAKRIEPLGWHVQLHMKADAMAAIEELLLRLPTPLVLDHVGRIPEPADLNSPSYQAVRRLVDAGHTWVKLSGPYQDSKVGPPTWSDVGVIANALVQAAPERMVWASDWPHPTVPTNKPDDAMLLDLLLDWAPDAATRQRILVENPQILYGFPKAG